MGIYIYVCMYVWMYGCMHGCMYVRTYVCMYVYMYVCMYISCTDTIGVCQGQIPPNTQVNIGVIEHMLCMLWVRARALGGVESRGKPRARGPKFK